MEQEEEEADANDLSQMEWEEAVKQATGVSGASKFIVQRIRLAVDGILNRRVIF